jgi:hypothetical protein
MAGEMKFRRDQTYCVTLEGGDEPVTIDAADFNVARSGALAFVERYFSSGFWFSPGFRLDREIRVFAPGVWRECRRVDHG